MAAEEKLKEQRLLEEYKEASACGSTNMDFKTWCRCRDSYSSAAVTVLELGRPNS